jgi:hypothetical protein
VGWPLTARLPYQCQESCYCLYSNLPSQFEEVTCAKPPFGVSLPSIPLALHHSFLGSSNRIRTTTGQLIAIYCNIYVLDLRRFARSCFCFICYSHYCFFLPVSSTPLSHSLPPTELLEGISRHPAKSAVRIWQFLPA